jgi:methylated-DNA-[protein]-cysteine S-methyltransferase
MNVATYTAYYRSEIGLMEINGTDEEITSVLFVEEERTGSGSAEFPAVIHACIRQLDEYFSGRRTQFTAKLQWRGTDFQKLVWNRLLSVPFGETVSYKALAASIGKETAVRAVGHANGKNRFAIVVPCHRVTGSNRGLTGYAWELWRKEWLLAHERKVRKTLNLE